MAGSKQQPEDELKASQQLIEHNLSNYSAWHYRSKLLPLVHPPPATSPHPVAEQALIKVHDSTPGFLELMQTIYFKSCALKFLVNRKHNAQKQIFLYCAITKFVLQELQMVVEAVFTDPSDQSPWFFLRWLVGRQEKEPR